MVENVDARVNKYNTYALGGNTACKRTVLGTTCREWSSNGTFIPGFILFFLLGFANAGIIVVVGPLMLRVTPREFVGRVNLSTHPS